MVMDRAVEFSLLKTIKDLMLIAEQKMSSMQPVKLSPLRLDFFLKQRCWF